MRADQLPYDRTGIITGVDWQSIDPATASRLRDFGVDEGVSIQLMHCGPVGRDPMAIRIGRMTVALRRTQAAAIRVALADAAE